MADALDGTLEANERDARLGGDVRIGVVYPELLGTYGDRGNAEILQWRLRARGRSAVVVPIVAGDNVPDDLDVYVLGGGEDLAQAAAARLLGSRSGHGLLRAIDRDAVVIAVCGSLQLLGMTYVDGEGREVPGLGVLDLHTVADAPRFVGETVIRMHDDTVLTGFENHGGRTFLGADATPFGTVLVGHGNNGKDATEGVRRGNLFGTYLHGPLLARNPALADEIALRVLRERGDAAPFNPLLDDPAPALHAARLQAAGFSVAAA